MTERTMDVNEQSRGLAAILDITNEMAEHQRAAVALGERRRALMLRLNREGMVSYRRLASVSHLTLSRVIDQLKKARNEAGITAPHPRGSSPNGSQ